MVKPAWKQDAVVLFSSCDDNYVPYLLVLLNSIIHNSSIENLYDIVIFEFSVSDVNKKKIEDMAVGHNNFSIRVINIKKELDFDESLLVTRTLTKEIWLKQLGIYAMKAYEKAIVIDCDVICLRDIADLYKIDLKDCLIGAVKFLNTYIYKNGNFYNRRYMASLEHDIKLEEDYFNYGVVLQNIQQFIERYPLESLLKIISTQNYLVQDQDMMNYLCKGSVLWIDSCWNTFPFTKDEFENTISLIPEKERDYWIKGYEEPACIHYTTPVKPWFAIKGVYSYAAKHFWRYAASLQNFDFTFFINQVKKYERDQQFFADILCKKYEDFLLELKDKELFVYGYGYIGKQIQKKHLWNIAGFVDLDEMKWNKALSIPIGGLELIEKPENAVILIANDKWDRIALDLNERGFKSIYSYACLEKRDYLSWRIEEDDLRAISNCFALLSDEKSRRLFDTLISKRNVNYIDRTIKYLDVQETNQYFRKDIFEFDDTEVYVDVGCYTGVTIEGFRNCVSDKYKKIYGFEMSEENYNVLCNKIRGNNIVLMNIALSNEQGQAQYVERGYGTHKWVDGKVVKSACLDHVIDEKVSFIKINVKNGKEVIEGAQNIIKKDKPKIAIDVSNNYADLWEIPLLLNSINPQYKFYLKHHMSDYTGTVLYVC